MVTDEDGRDDCVSETVRENQERRAWFRREILPLEPRLRAYLRRIAPRDVDVDDLTHDILVRLISTPGWRQVGSPAAFVRTTARNLVYDLLRRRRVVPIDFVADLESVEFLDPGADAETALIGRDELRLLSSLVEGLPPQCRRVFTLRKIDGLSPREIAERLGLSVSTVEKHLVKALRICSEGLARRTDGHTAATHDTRPQSAARRRGQDRR